MNCNERVKSQMIWAQQITQLLKAYHIRFLSYVPDAIGEQILQHARQDDFFDILPLAREEEGVGVVAGQYVRWIPRGSPNANLRSRQCHQCLSLTGDSL